jgi:segregation and condensation protein B
VNGPAPGDAGDGAPDDGAPEDGAPEDGAPDALDLDLLPGGPRAALEAVLMVVEAPAPEDQLASALGLPRDRVRGLLEELAGEYVAQRRGFELREVAGGWRVYSRADTAPVVERFVRDGQTARLSRAALETLAVVAYRQPVSRARVGAVRGVSVDAVMRTLLTRGLVEEVGTDPATGATLYGTTTTFLERMGLNSVDDLPALAPYLPGDEDLDELSGELR